ncbi:hypothetical protein ABN034_03930 [Actinopolymorpha sp. B11F2]|uniref:hypothetical protein n=1 Tax=Actinopolymorpha sp. B11F2 TaxID=3160862 RepID=UPI0032E5252A
MALIWLHATFRSMNQQMEIPSLVTMVRCQYLTRTAVADMIAKATHRSRPMVSPRSASMTVVATSGMEKISAHQPVDERAKQLPQQIRRRGRQLLVQKPVRCTTRVRGHRVDLL